MSSPHLAGEDVSRTGRLRQGQSRQAQFRFGRHRHDAASRRRDVQAAHRHRRDAHSLQGHRCVLHRHDERQGADGVLQHRRRAAVHHRQSGAGDRHHRARSAHASIPTCRRSPRRALRASRSTVARRVRARRAAAPMLAQAQRRADQGAGRLPDLKAAFAKVGVEPRGTSPEEGATFLQRRVRQMEEGHHRRQDQGRTEYVARPDGRRPQ